MKLSVETPYGIVTRQTERAYKFVVVSYGESETYLRRRHEEAAAYMTRQAAKYREAEATDGASQRPLYNFSGDQYRIWAEQAEAKAAAPFVMPAAKRAVHGWSGSARGAQKMADEAARYGHLGILVIPVGLAATAEAMA